MSSKYLIEERQVLIMKYGVSSVEVKKLNRNRVFRFVNNRERTSMPDIASALDMSGPTVLQMVKELKELKVIQEVGEYKSTGGRKAKAIAAVPNVRYAVGVDITKNHIGLVLTNLSEKVLKHIRITRSFAFTDSYFRELSETIETFIGNDIEIRKGMTGVGISMPCIVFGSKNRITNSHALGIYDISCDEISHYINYPCVFINDANAAAMTEYILETRPGNVVYLSLSNTVGGAIALRQEQELESCGDLLGSMFDKMYVGNDWHSGEFGHMVIHPDGVTCYCGKKGCLDSYCSALRLAEAADDDLDLFFQKLMGGDKKMETVFNQYLEHLAIAVDNLRMCFDCDIVLGGYVGSLMGPYINNLQNKVKEKNIFESDGKYVRACRYQLEASALGAGIYYIEEFINTI